MPIYRYKCPTCSAQRDVFKTVAQLDRKEECLKCSFPMNRQICAPAVLGDYAPYDCPITGKRIEGRKAHLENLAEHGCRVLEAGEKEQVMRQRQADDEAFEEAVGETAASFVANLPAAKQERLAAELDNGIDTAVTRSTPTIN